MEHQPSTLFLCVPLWLMGLVFAFAFASLWGIELFRLQFVAISSRILAASNCLMLFTPHGTVPCLRVLC
jgi:hypothetical protein